jgi:4-amino-4-deoxy-L-arabinose transferase-like glycosyltransferase
MIALAVCLAVALGVRLWGIGWQLPWQFHPDEGHYTWKALDMIGDESLNPKYFRNPSLFTYLLYGQYRLLGFRSPAADDQAASQDGLLRPPSGVAFLGRLNSALLGTATVAAVATMGWRLLGPWTAALAAAFLGLAFIHVRDSHYATNDVPATFLLILSVAACLALVGRPTPRAYLLAGLFGGLATSAKYNAGMFLVPLLVAHAIALVGDGPCLGWRRWGKGRQLHSALACSLLVAAAAYLLGTPYTLLTFDQFWADFRTQMRLGGEGWEGQVAGPSGGLYLQALGQGIGWVMLGLSVVGLSLLARRRPREAAVIAAFPVAYLLFMLRTELFFARFALPVVPFLCLLAACAVVLLVEGVRGLIGRRVGPPPTGRRLAPVVGGGLAVVALIQPAYDVALHNTIIGREDSRVLAADWALANIPPDAKVALEEYTIRDRRPRAYGGPSWRLDTDLFNVNSVPGADPAAALRGRYQYVIVSSFQYERFQGDAPKLARQTAFYGALEREGRLVATFGPGRDGAAIPFDLEDLYTPFWRLERYERPGPTVKIYAIGE